MTRNLYIAEYERLYERALNNGCTHEDAEKYAEQFVHDAMREKLADYADYSRKKAKEQS